MTMMTTGSPCSFHCHLIIITCLSFPIIVLQPPRSSQFHLQPSNARTRFPLVSVSLWGRPPLARPPALWASTSSAPREVMSPRWERFCPAELAAPEGAGTLSACKAASRRAAAPCWCGCALGDQGDCWSRCSTSAALLRPAHEGESLPEKAGPRRRRRQSLTRPPGAAWR